jgi:type III secretory pathway component EscT
MHALKKFAVGVAMTLVTVAVGFYLVRRFAPENVKQFFTVA